MTELTFEAPDAGIWEQDGTHFPRPVTRLLQEVFCEGFVKGFRMGTACYGLLLDHIAPAFVNGFFYNKMVIVGAPEDATGPPPERVFRSLCETHPELRRRLETAATVLQKKPWREHIVHWDTVLKPQSMAHHLRLQSRDMAPLSDPALAGYLQECFDNSKAMVFQHHVYTVSCCIPVGDFMASTQEWTGLAAAEVAQALRGSTPISAGVTDEYLAALGALAADAAARAVLHGPGEARAVLDTLRALPGAAGRAVGTYLDLVSHRVVGGYDICCPTAIETPGVLLTALRQGGVAQQQAQADQQVRQQTAKIRAAVPAQHLALFDEILEEARFVNRLRDERSYWSDLWASGILRRAVLEAGRRLALGGRVGQAEHALDATLAELQALLTEDGPAPIADELARRHQFRATVAADAAPPTLNGSPSAPPPADWLPPQTRRTMRAMGVFMSHIRGSSDSTSDARTVRGIAVSAGQYEGRARVIDGIEQLGQLQKGEVLVARSTSTSFNHVLPLIGAIVTDRGGLMSHAAIVAREFGLPGVVGCQVATRMIPNGARVRVDADKGEVIILS